MNPQVPWHHERPHAEKLRLHIGTVERMFMDENAYSSYKQCSSLQNLAISIFFSPYWSHDFTSSVIPYISYLTIDRPVIFQLSLRLYGLSCTNMGTLNKQKKRTEIVFQRPRTFTRPSTQHSLRECVLCAMNCCRCSCKTRVTSRHQGGFVLLEEGRSWRAVPINK